VTFIMTPISNGELNRMPYLKLKNPDTAFRDDSDCKSVKILDYTNYKCVLEKGRTLQLSEITNYGRGLSPCGTATSQNRCVMCGVTDAAIPTQNKNVCKACDSVPWLLKSPEVVVKFCKGRSFLHHLKTTGSKT
jgi:hypothetical protein